MLEVPGFRLLFDCGMFQGRREEAVRRNRDLGFEPKSLGAVLLSHAHVDHSGALPVLPRQGFSGKVYLTRASADLTEIMLEDSARVQENDCRYVNKQERRRGKARAFGHFTTGTRCGRSSEGLREHSMAIG